MNRNDPTAASVLLLFLAFAYLMLTGVVSGMARAEILFWSEVAEVVRTLSVIFTLVVASIVFFHVSYRPPEPPPKG